jgi:hypothetical protein
MGSNRSRAYRAVFAIPVLAVLVSSQAFAQQPPAQPTASDRETARSLMAEGRDKRDAGDLHAALKAFVAADTIMHVPTTGLEVARTLDQMGQLVEARETLIAVLRIPPQPSDPAPFAEARRAAEALDADLAKRIPSITIEASSELPGAITVIVDEQTIPANLVSIPRKLNPGKHVVIAKAAGEEARETFDLAPREQKRVTLRVVKKPPPPPPETHRDPAPDIGEGPSSNDDTKRPIPLVTWIGLGVGAAGVLSGTITGIISISKTNALEGCEGDQCPRSQQSDIDSARTFATVADVSFVVAGVGLAVAAVGYFVLRPKAKTPTTGFVTVTPGGLAGTF